VPRPGGIVRVSVLSVDGLSERLRSDDLSRGLGKSQLEKVFLEDAALKGRLGQRGGKLEKSLKKELMAKRDGRVSCPQKGGEIGGALLPTQDIKGEVLS